jgi:hypothetical protein
MGRPETRPRVVIIGARPLVTRGFFQARSSPNALARFIDTSDVVIRMNNIKNVGVPGLGNRTDILAVTNTGQPGHRYAHAARLDHPMIAGAAEIWFGTPSELAELGEFQGTGDPLAGRDWAPEILSFQGWSNRRHDAIAAEITRNLGAKLKRLGSSKPDPSLGVRVIARVLEESRFSDHVVHLVGFGFRGPNPSPHDFKAEHAWVRGLEREARITRTPGNLGGLFYLHALSARCARLRWCAQHPDQVDRLRGTAPAERKN